MQNGRYPNSTNIQRQLLPNGVTVLVYENFASQSVVMEGVVRAGSLADTKETAGLARLTSSTLMRGTDQRRFDQIYEDL